MESETPKPPFSPEQIKVQPDAHGERQSSWSSETGIEESAEKFERRGELRAASSDSAAIALPVPIAVPASPSSQSSGASLPVDDMPLIANDDDLIEKEWVDKAKKIIIDTQDDPHRREEAVGQLQRDYLKKRYGREIGENGDSA